MTLSLLSLMTPAGDGSNTFTVLLVQIALFGAIIYFLILRPNAQARRKHEGLLANLKKGDEITTAGGLIGKVKEIREDKEHGQTRVTIESGTATLVVERSRIVRVGNSVAPGTQG